MSDMFGSPAGTVARTAMDSEQALHAAQTQEIMGKVAMQPAQGRVEEVKAQEAEMELAMRRKFAEQAAARQGGVGQTPTAGQTDLAGQLDGMAQTAMDAGLIDKAAGIAEKASQIRSHTATANSAKAMEQERIYKTQIDRAEATGKWFGNATDDVTWQAAERAYQGVYGKPSPWAGMSYDPDLAKRIGQQSMQVKDRLEQQLQTNAQEQLRMLRENEQVEREKKNKLTDARVELTKTRTDALRKAGAAGPKDTSPVRRMALETLQNDWADMSKSEAGLFADQIAERSKELMKQSPGMKGSEAMTRAYGELKDSDALYGYTPNTARPTKTTPVPAQKSLAESYGQPYDPAYEYKEQGGQLLRRKK